MKPYNGGKAMEDEYEPQTDPLIPPRRKKPRLLRLLLWENVMDIGITDRLVRGLIGTGSLAMLYGPPGCGKSFLALDMGAHIAAGWTWFGLPVERCGVVYVAAEGQLGIGKRIAAIRKRHRLDIDANIPFALLPQPIDLRNAAVGDTAALIATIKEGAGMADAKIGLIVIDTLSRCFGGGNENSPEDMGAFQANIDRIRTETGAAVLVVHHSGKDDTRGMRGHSILQGAADTVIEVSGMDGARTFTVRKQKDGEIGTPYAFNLDVEEVDTDQDGNPITSCVVTPTGAAPSASRQKKRPVSPEALKCTDYLKDKVADIGTTVAANGIPPGVRVVKIDIWRDYLKQRGLYTGDAASRKWFERMKNRLIAENLIAINGDYVWLVSKH